MNNLRFALPELPEGLELYYASTSFGPRYVQIYNDYRGGKSLKETGSVHNISASRVRDILYKVQHDLRYRNYGTSLIDVKSFKYRVIRGF